MFRCVGDGAFQCTVIPPTGSILDFLDRYAMPGQAPDMDALREQMAEDMEREVLRNVRTNDADA